MKTHPTKQVRTLVIDANVRYIKQPFACPLVISSGTIDGATEARVRVTVRVGDRESTGRGSVYLSVLWAWPESHLTVEERDRELRHVCQYIADHLPELTADRSRTANHPLVLGMKLHDKVCHSPIPNETGDQPQPIPPLALAMALSPFDAAIHDAVGQALERSAFDLYVDPFEVPEADGYFREGAQPAIRRMLRTRPVRQFPAWLIIGKQDDLESDVKPWVQNRRYRCVKIKTTGTDIPADIERTIAIHRALKHWGVEQPRLTVDSNEASPDTEAVLAYLEGLRRADGDAYRSLEYMEQPTDRDISQHAFDWHKVTQSRPVLLDEGLHRLDQLQLAAEQGWSGFALKTCKGHSFALICAAWAHEQGLLLSLQDLTNPGYSAMHAALFAGHVPTINGVELNSPQFTPEANRPWLVRFRGLFEPHDGTHRLDCEIPNGLGTHFMDSQAISVNE